MGNNQSHGIIFHNNSCDRKTDYLFRISLKGLIKNEKGEVLVVKEIGRTNWDLPGGGMDHGEDIKTALGREMKEEVNLEGDFAYRVIAVDDPKSMLTQNIIYLRIIFEITPSSTDFSLGDDGYEIGFFDPRVFKNSGLDVERQIYEYCNIR